MFRKLFSLEINKQQVAVGFGNPGNKNDALYDEHKKRIILRKSMLGDIEYLKRVLRHEAVHVVVGQIDETLAEQIEEAVDRADAAMTTFLLEHPEVVKPNTK